MSRYNINSNVFVGWNDPLQTFFVQVVNSKSEEVWATLGYEKLDSVQKLKEVLQKRDLVLPDEIQQLLIADQMNGF